MFSDILMACLTVLTHKKTDKQPTIPAKYQAFYRLTEGVADHSLAIATRR